MNWKICYKNLTRLAQSCHVYFPNELFLYRLIFQSIMSSSRFLNQLSKRGSKPLILDGSLGTLLPESAQSHALWSTYSVIEQPSVISKIHKTYLQNGAQVVQTSTYQTSEDKLKEFYPELSYRDVITKSVDLAWDAIQETTFNTEENDKLIAGAIGPYGASLANGSEYTGIYPEEMTLEKMIAFHEIRLNTLCEDQRVDLIGFETIPNLLELKVCLRMMKARKNPYYIALSVNGETLADGSSIEAIKEVIDAEASDNLFAIGVNCLGMSDSLNWLRKLMKFFDLKLVVYPNSGEKYDADRSWHPCDENELDWDEYLCVLSGEEFKGKLAMVGGCCRTDEEHTKLISKSF